MRWAALAVVALWCLFLCAVFSGCSTFAGAAKLEVDAVPAYTCAKSAIASCPAKAGGPADVEHSLCVSQAIVRCSTPAASDAVGLAVPGGAPSAVRSGSDVVSVSLEAASCVYVHGVKCGPHPKRGASGWGRYLLCQAEATVTCVPEIAPKIVRLVGEVESTVASGGR